jgi:hypothetical protein
MPLSDRLKRFCLVACLAIVLAFALSFAAWLSVVASAIAFSGTSANSWSTFVRAFSPLAHFSVGAYLTGCVIGLVSSLSSSSKLWFGTICIGAAIGGVLSVVVPKLGATLASISVPVVRLVSHF